MIGTIKRKSLHENLGVRLPLEALVDVEGYGADARNTLVNHLTVYMTAGTIIRFTIAYCNETNL